MRRNQISINKKFERKATNINTTCTIHKEASECTIHTTLTAFTKNTSSKWNKNTVLKNYGTSNPKDPRNKTKRVVKRSLSCFQNKSALNFVSLWWVIIKTRSNKPTFIEVVYGAKENDLVRCGHHLREVNHCKLSKYHEEKINLIIFIFYYY